MSRLRLEDAGFTVIAASSAQQALELAATESPDAVLSDVIMGEMDGFGLCRRLRQRQALANVPIVLLSAHYGDPKARELAISVGASALIGRTPEFDAELRALRSVLSGEHAESRGQMSQEVYEAHLRSNANELHKLVGEAKDAENRYRALFESAHDTISVLDRAGIVLEANQRWHVVLGTDPASLIGRHLLAFAPNGVETTFAELAAAIERGSGRVNGVAFERPDRAIVYLDFSITVVTLGEASLVLAIGRDVTDRFLSAQALATAEEKYRSLVERMPDVVWTSTNERCTFVTNNIERLTGFSPAEIYAIDAQFWRGRVHADDEQRFLEALGSGAGQGPRAYDLEYRWRRKDGAWVWLWHRTIAIYERGGIFYSDGLISDITQRKQLEQSLRQAQKMEALGQLTAGIAHDFNNILATIMANSQFLIEACSENDPRLADAQEIKLASDRAASLTRQLLAFSRKQLLEVRTVDLNQVIVSVERLLRRLIGEDIEMVVALCASLGTVQVDSSQIEQVVMNLAVNARDAMPMGGKLTLETMNVDLDAGYLSNHAVGPPGRYVVVTVSDTGTGMDAETQHRIFEPFFTTKALGKGTGLGLATCHGIVSQSGGHIGVYSEVGRGTTFKVYLPRSDQDAVPDSTRIAERALRGSETVLLVEDDAALRAAVQRMLSGQGYRVLLARSCDEAIEIARRRGKDLALLVTDVVMPVASGPEVAKAVQAQVPRVKVLYMSGYTDHAALANGVLSRTMNFIQKPFSPQALAKKVREAIDG